GSVRRDPGPGLQAHRQARVPDGPDPPPFRASRLVRADGRDPLLDHQLRARAGGPCNAEAAVITAKAFAGKHYAVYGLARSGLATVEALLASGANVTAWDDKLFPGEGRDPGQREPLLHSGLDPGLRRGTEIANLNEIDLTQ